MLFDLSVVLFDYLVQNHAEGCQLVLVLARCDLSEECVDGLLVHQAIKRVDEVFGELEVLVLDALKPFVDQELNGLAEVYVFQVGKVDLFELVDDVQLVLFALLSCDPK